MMETPPRSLRIGSPLRLNLGGLELIDMNWTKFSFEKRLNWTRDRETHGPAANFLGSIWVWQTAGFGHRNVEI
jgi:hypothetical protein